MESRKIKAIILANEYPDDHLLWSKACEFYSKQVEYRIVNLTVNDWLEEIQSGYFDILLARPGGITSHFKQLYDERIYILNKVLDYKVFPSSEEIFIYENKRFLSFWLEANKIPHPKTDVFFNQVEALDCVDNLSFPIVVKVNIGASGSGVRILRNKQDAKKYIKQTFNGKGVPRRSGPNLDAGGILKRGLHYLVHPGDIKEKINLYKTISSHPQKDFVIIQEYIPHKYEWRIVRIGDSFFAHKKLKIAEKASGSLLKEYGNPPLNILDFVKEITDSHNFYSQCVDIFESDRGYLINEMQCIFGQSDPYQMLVDGKPGRYKYIQDEWIFEEGDFAGNECYNLRIEFVLNGIIDRFSMKTQREELKGEM